MHTYGLKSPKDNLTFVDYFTHSLDRRREATVDERETASLERKLNEGVNDLEAQVPLFFYDIAVNFGDKEGSLCNLH